MITRLKISIYEISYSRDVASLRVTLHLITVFTKA